MVSFSRLPNFFIIGAPKAGSTSLFRYLSQHPDVYFPRKKEIDFFVDERLYRKGLHYLESAGYRGAEGFAARGDASVQSLLSVDAPHRIRHDLPSGHHRFIAILRNPIDRAYSAYWWEVREGSRLPPFINVMQQEEARLEDLRRNGARWWKYAHLQHGLYARNLHNWMREFPRSAFKIFLYEDLRDLQSVMDETLGFLGLERNATLDISTRHNVASQARWPRLQWLVASDNPVKRALQAVLPPSMATVLGQAMRRVNRRPFQYPPMGTDAWEFLSAYFDQDISELEELLDRSLEAWRMPPSVAAS